MKFLMKLLGKTETDKVMDVPVEKIKVLPPPPSQFEVFYPGGREDISVRANTLDEVRSMLEHDKRYLAENKVMKLNTFQPSYAIHIPSGLDFDLDDIEDVMFGEA